MASRLAFIAGLTILFGITVLILLRVLPGPHKSTDYLVAGTVATFVCIAVVFLVNLAGRPAGTFFRRRAK